MLINRNELIFKTPQFLQLKFQDDAPSYLCTGTILFLWFQDVFLLQESTTINTGLIANCAKYFLYNKKDVAAFEIKPSN